MKYASISIIQQYTAGHITDQYFYIWYDGWALAVGSQREHWPANLEAASSIPEK